MLKCVLLVCAYLASSHALKLPSYITACKVGPELNKCALEQAIKGLPHILKGDTKYGIPKMNPMMVPSIELNPGSNLKINFQNLNVDGLETTEIKDVKIDLEKKHWVVKADIKYLNLTGNYEIDGKILVLPIKGKGNSEVIFEEPHYTFEFDQELYTKDGEEYLKIVNPQLTFPPFKTRYHFNNLFNGDKKLGDEMNKFLNDNWQDVNKDLGPAFGDAISSIITNIVTNIAKKVPYKDIIHQ